MKQLFNEKLESLDELLLPKFNRLAQNLGAELFLTIGEPDFDTPKVIKQTGIQALEDGLTKYSLTPGSIKLRRAISGFEKQTNYANYSVDEVLVTAGSTEGLSIALTTILNVDDEVIVLTPAYPQYSKSIGLVGGKAVFVDTSKTDFQVSEKLLLSVITEKTKAIIITSPNNPTGTILNEKSIQTISKLAKEHEFFILSDECYNQIVFTESSPLAISSDASIKDWLIVCQSFSKPYAMPGWRLGYILASAPFIEQAKKTHQYTAGAVNTFVQEAGIAALWFDPKEMVVSYQKRRDYVYKRLLEIGLEVVKPEGAFYIFPSIKQFGLSSWEFCERLVKEEKVALLPGICFEAEGYIRLSFCVEKQVIVESLNRLEQFVLRLTGEKSNGV